MNLEYQGAQKVSFRKMVVKMSEKIWKILIWGTAGIAQELYNNGINGEILGYVESNKSRKEFNGYPVYDVCSIPNGWDYIIVANRFTDEIYDLCVRLKFNMSKIVFLRHGKKFAYNDAEEIRGVLGEKNYTRYAQEYGVWRNTFVEDDMVKYSSMNVRPEFAIKEEYLYPLIADKYDTSCILTGYFWQDLWAAKKIIAEGVKEHFDIGSRVDGFIAHLLAAGIKVNVIDIRPFPTKVEGLTTILDDATMLSQFEDDSISSISALCSLEHFGLGRYGDPVDPESCFQCMAQIQKKMKKGGRLYISVPIGQNRVEFNAHRVFYADTIISIFDQLNLVEYSVTDNGDIEYNADIHKYDSYDKGRVMGLFLFEK